MPYEFYNISFTWSVNLHKYYYVHENYRQLLIIIVIVDYYRQ